MTDRDDAAAAEPRFALYYASLVPAKGLKGPVVAPKVMDGAMVGADPLIAHRGRVDFVRDGSALQFALAPLPVDSIPADPRRESDLRSVALRGHSDHARAEAQRRTGPCRTWDAIYQVALKKCWQRLADAVTIADNGRHWR